MKINNVDIKKIAKKYGTPIFVYDEARIISNFNNVKNAFSKKYPNFKIYYAIKANNNPTLAKLLIKEGAGIDASSVNEIKLAKYLGLKGNDIISLETFYQTKTSKEA